jgi:predicted nicotinamide N-methyase
MDARVTPPGVFRRLMQSSDAEELFRTISSLYDIRREIIDVGARRVEIASVRDTNVLVDAIAPEEFAVDERLPYWADLWSSSLAIADRLLRGPSLGGHSILELGCGLGLSGIAAAMTGGRVTLTDYESDALLFARWNMLHNLGSARERERVRFALLDWRAPDLHRRYDVILGADIVYERLDFPPLLRLIDEALAPDGVAFFGDPGRTIGDDFLRAAAAAGFRVTRSVHPVRRHGRESAVVIAEIRRKEGE